MKNNREYFKNTDQGWEYEGNSCHRPFHKILNDEDMAFLDDIKGIVNKHCTGEQYVRFCEILDRLNSIKPDNEAIKEFCESASWALKLKKTYGENKVYLGDKFSGVRYAFEDRVGYYWKRIITETKTDVDDNYLDIPIDTNDFNAVEKSVKKFLEEKHESDFDRPLTSFARKLSLFDDYWGNYCSFDAQLRIIDVAYILDRMRKTVIHFLNDYAKFYGEESRHYEYKKHEFSDFDVDMFIRDWNEKYEEDWDVPKLATRPVEEPPEEI